MIKSAFLALVTTAATLGAPSAHAGGVSWSIGINAPVVGAVISNGPAYGSYYEPAYGPVYAPVPVYERAPVYRVAPPVAYYPEPIYYRSEPVVYPRYYPGWRHGHRGWDRDEGHHGDHDRRDGRDGRDGWDGRGHR